MQGSSVTRVTDHNHPPYALDGNGEEEVKEEKRMWNRAALLNGCCCQGCRCQEAPSGGTGECQEGL